MNKYSVLENLRNSRIMRRGSVSNNSYTIKSIDLSSSIKRVHHKANRSDRKSALSILTNQQNMLMKNQSEMRPFKVKTGGRDSADVRSTRDFTKILNNLDAVIGVKQVEKPILIKDRAPHTYSIGEGQTQYFKIECNGKKCPLRIDLKQLSGSVKVFVSRNNAYPSENNCDFIAGKDSFTVSDNKYYFSTEFVSIGIFALISSECSISISFGRDISSRMSENLKEKLIGDTISCAKSSLKVRKNFIEKNKLFLNKEEPVNFLTWDERKEKVKERRKIHLETKKNKSWLLINRNEILKQERMKIVEEEERTKMERNRQKTWISYIYLIPTIKQLQDFISYQRQIKMEAIRKSQLARKIQTQFRKRFLGTELTNMIRTSYLLHAFSHTKSHVESKLVSHIKLNQIVSLPKRKFIHFRIQVEKIQNAWRQYSKINRKRWNQLLKVFCAFLKNKRIKKKIKKRVLFQYFQRTKLDYLKRAKRHSTSLLFLHRFEFLPSEQKMLDLIRSSA